MNDIDGKLFPECDKSMTPVCKWCENDTICGELMKDMTYDEVKELLQRFVFDMNIPSRVGNESPEFKYSDFKHQPEEEE